MEWSMAPAGSRAGAGELWSQNRVFLALSWALAAGSWHCCRVAEHFPPETEYVTIPELVERWGVSPSRVHRYIEDHHLAAVRIDGVLSIPADFVEDDQPLASLRGTLLVLLDAGFTRDESLAWLYERNDELGERPIDSLLAGRKSAVRRATQSLAF